MPRLEYAAFKAWPTGVEAIGIEQAAVEMKDLVYTERATANHGAEELPELNGK